MTVVPVFNSEGELWWVYARFIQHVSQTQLMLCRGRKNGFPLYNQVNPKFLSQNSSQVPYLDEAFDTPQEWMTISAEFENQTGEEALKRQAGKYSAWKSMCECTFWRTILRTTGNVAEWEFN